MAFQATGDVKLVPVVVLGIVERFLEPEMVDVLKKGDDSVKFMEDLGLDSLTMFEAIMMVEESLGISIKNEELLDLRSVGDLKKFIQAKLAGIEGETTKSYSLEQIAATLPQQEPFLFLHTAAISGEGARGTYRISGEEAFLAGHFKDNPVFPASIMLESLGQLGVFHFLKTGLADAGEPESSIYFAGVDGVRCHRIHLGVPDATGRQAPQVVEDSSFTIPADMAILALGFDPEDLPEMFGEKDLKVSRWGTLSVDFTTMMTSLDGVFAAGDIVRGASLVVWAVRDGRDAAEEMHSYIQAKAGATAVAAE